MTNSYDIDTLTDSDDKIPSMPHFSVKIANDNYCGVEESQV
jgi:hypothetical protein